MAKATEKVLGDLHSELARVLTKAIEPEPVVLDGEVVGHKLNASALNVARQFLKDNNITATTDSKPVRDLVDSLPSFEDESAFNGANRLN